MSGCELCGSETNPLKLIETKWNGDTEPTGRWLCRNAARCMGRNSRQKSVAVCGTRAGYSLHLRRDEPTCEACREAERARERNGRTKR